MSAPFADDTIVEDLPLASSDDKEIALAFQRGEKGAYQVVYDRHRERVHRVCRRMLGKPEDAQEAAQETFLRVYTALGKFNGRYQLGAWITRIATNVCLDQIRARARRPVEATPIEELEAEVLASGADSDPEALSVRRAESRRVRKVLMGLPPLHRAAIVLRDFEGLSYAEVAVALGITECQVKALIHRARKGFRRSWTPLAEMLVPARLLQRWRDVDVSVKDQVVHVAASQSAPVATFCSGVLQQCGSFVVDRVMPVMTTLVISGTAVAAPGAASGPSDTSEARVAAPGADLASDGRTAGGRVRPPSAPSAVRRDPSAGEPAAAPSPTPAPSESPAATPAPSPPPASASPPPPSGAATTPKEAVQPSFAPVLYFEQGQAPTPRAPASNTTRVNCAARSIDQTMSATVTDRDGSYPIDVRFKGGSSFTIEFTVHKAGQRVYYSGGGPLTSVSGAGDELRLSFTGRYGTAPSAAQSANLPSEGSVRAEFSLDCQAQSLVAENIVFATD
jgi:RNA polymerase sigma-70 factor (ECF subfamily)